MRGSGSCDTTNLGAVCVSSDSTPASACIIYICIRRGPSALGRALLGSQSHLGGSGHPSITPKGTGTGDETSDEDDDLDLNLGTGKCPTTTPAAKCTTFSPDDQEQGIGNFLMLKLKNEGLLGALVYYDGQHNDLCMNAVPIMTTVKHGAVVANYCEVTKLHKDVSEKLTSARVKDGLSGREWNVKAKDVINAAGPFSDALLKLDNPSHYPIVQPFSGIHITLPNYPRKMGYGSPRNAWSDLWPLVRSPGAVGTEGLVRNHMIHLSEGGLLTIAGGKWTTYRAMAEETVDRAAEAFLGWQARRESSDGWSRNMLIGLIQTYGMNTVIAKHLSESYEDRTWTVCSLAEPTGESWPLHGKRLYPAYTFIEAEVRHEHVQMAIDVLAKRTRLSFLNARAAFKSLPRVVDIMSKELGSSYTERKQIRDAVAFLKSISLDPGSRFEAGEFVALGAAFERRASGDGNGKVRRDAMLGDVPEYEEVLGKDYVYVLEEAGFGDRVDVDFDEFVEISGNLTEVSVTPSEPVTEQKVRIVEKSGVDVCICEECT
ncbi:hypothetical protein BDQ17DRAFT_1546383 [Cyathus striatus]|nr:hypothetical protein BDQ17DRAFT_1546383 [Cyathus striatus]